MRIVIAGLLVAAAAWAQGTTVIQGNREIKGNLTVDGTFTGSITSTPNCVSDPTVVCVIEPFAPGSNGNIQIGVLGWATVGSPTITQYAGSTTHRGGYQIASGAAANNTTDIEDEGGSTVAAFPRLSDQINWTALFKFTTPSSLTEYVMEIGFGTTPGSGSILGQGAYLRYANSTGCDGTNHPNLSDTTWMYVTNDGTTTNASSGPAIAASTTYWLRLRNTGTSGQIAYSLKAEGGSFPADTVLSSNISTAAVLPLFKQTVCNTTSRTLQMSWFSYLHTGLN